MIESLHGVLSSVPAWEGILLFGLAAVMMAWAGARFPAWVFVAALGLFGWGAPSWTWAVLAAIVVVFGVPPVRRLLSRLVMGSVISRGRLPSLSRAEREAVEAGGVGLEAGIFAGRPDLGRLAAAEMPGLSSEERAFLDGPVQSICDGVEPWDVVRRRDLAPATWQLLARHRVFGLAIPREHGGHGFSASAVSAVIAKAASTSPTLGAVVSASTTFGATGLVARFASDAQKQRWLGDLASHREVAALALADRGGAADPGFVTARGEVFRRDDDRLGVRLSWDKAFVALGPVATLLVVVFRLRDPRNLLGKGPDPGITCALVPVVSPGVRAGGRHDVAGNPFPMGTSIGEDVLLDLEESVIGGLDGVGMGWRMLTDAVAGSWGLGAVAAATGHVKQVARVASAHGVLSAGFGNAASRVDGVEEGLARIAGRVYGLEAARRFACGALDLGIRSGVLAAVLTRHALRAQRDVETAGREILGPHGIAAGPEAGFVLSTLTPAISVPSPGSGFNPSSRVIFGMGVFRCHPFLARAIEAVESHDVRAFDAAFWGYAGHAGRNAVRALLLSVTRGGLSAPPTSGPSARYWRRLEWASASFAFWSDVAIVSRGGRIRQDERLLGHLADIFTDLVTTAVVLRRFDADGRRVEDVPLLQWSAHESLARVDLGFEALFDTLQVRGLTWLIRGPVAAWSRLNRLVRGQAPVIPSRVATAVRVPGPHRERLLGGVHVATRAMARLEKALSLSHDTEGIHAALRDAVRVGRIPRTTPALMLESALSAGVISRVEVERILRAEEAREEAMRVATFSAAEFFATAVPRPRSRRAASDGGKKKPAAAPEPPPEKKPARPRKRRGGA